MRRLLYWWHLLHVSKSEMIFKVYYAQKLSPVCGDWIELLEKDKEQFGINISDDEVSNISQQKFKKYVKQKSIEVTIEFLEKLKKKNSKSKQLDVTDMTTSPYLLDSRFSKAERELLFRLRSRTILVKENFSNAYPNNDMMCELCKLFPCTQFHPIQCPELNASIIVEKTLNINENFIYGTIDEQLVYVKIYKHFWDLREKIFKERKEETDVS